MKNCTRCKSEKARSEFYRNRTHKDGLQSWCKACWMEYQQSEACKESLRKHGAGYRKANTEKIKARNAVNNALRDGRLHKEPCPCGETNVQGHHEDYSKLLDVEWLCSKHHID